MKKSVKKKEKKNDIKKINDLEKKDIKDIKLSIIVPNYNNEKYLDKSVNYLLSQAYKNVEIIVVNDGSKGNSDEIMEKYMKDNRVKYIKHDVNKGLFQARLTGSDVATGDYIAFLDADDYASYDYYRTLVMKAVETDADMVIGNTVLEYDDGRRIQYPLFNMNFDILEGSKCLDEYFKQDGLIFSWHTVWNKIYSMELWKKARKHYDDIKTRLIMTEDFAFSSVLFYYVRKIATVKNDAIFYCQHEFTSTSVKDINANKAKNNIKDLLTSFNFVEAFMKKVKIYDKYKDNFYNWKHLYSLQHREQINSASKIDIDTKSELLLLLNNYCDDETTINNHWFFSMIETEWDERLEKLKLLISDDKIKCVSFDIFDTLVVRPFLQPVDLFRLMDDYYMNISCGKSAVKFSKFRVLSEQIARDNQFKKDSSIQEVCLDDIYRTIKDVYNLDDNELMLLKNKEIELEKRFCKRRQTAYELFTLAKDLGKKVICTSDMYLSKDVIEDILKNNGYFPDEIYLSCDVGKTKWTGDLFKVMLEKTGFKASSVLHIGDNYETDYSRAKSLGMEAVHFIKTTDLFLDKKYSGNLSQMLNSSLPFWFDNRESQSFMGIRTMTAFVANMYFDNPFRPFDLKTDFNYDPYLIGYYALGMYVFGVTNWLLKGVNGVNDKISFMARDGYLIMESYNIMKKLFDKVPVDEYMYVSRKALIPIMITDKLDFYKLSDFIEINKQTPKSILKYISNVIKVDTSRLEKMCELENIKFDSKFKDLIEFNNYIKIIVDNFYDEEYHRNNRKKLKEYFDKVLGEKPAVFDVGYSGRPEYYLGVLSDKKIDTYFLNINRDDAIEYARFGKFNLYTFFPAKPTATGNAYELLFSKLAPSCIGYDVTKNEVKPIFEEYDNDYQVYNIVNTMQQAALRFVSDIVNTFGKDVELLYYQDYYVALPILAYFNGACDLDRLPLSCVMFEDEIRTGEKCGMVDDMKKDLSTKNQSYLSELVEGTMGSGEKNVGNLTYTFVDLSKKSRFSRLLYYILFDRKTFKRRMSEIKHNMTHKK